MTTSYRLEMPHVKPSDEQSQWSGKEMIVAVFGYFCFPYTGIAALLNALMAYSDHKANDAVSSAKKRKKALWWGVASIIIGASLLILTYTMLGIFVWGRQK